MSILCKLCGETLSECMCTSLPEDHSGEMLCETCSDKEKCEEREAEPAILHDQIVHCHEVAGKPSFISDEEWVQIWREGKEDV
jgi:hypothetical protein